MKREIADKAFIVCLVSLLTRKPKLFRDLVVRSFCVSRFTVNKKTSEFTHYSFVGKRRARGSFRRSGRVPARCAVCGSRAPRPWPLARATRPIFHRFISHMPYRLSFCRAGVSYYCKHRVMKSARLDYYTELDHVDFLEKRLDLHVGLLSVD